MGNCGPTKPSLRYSEEPLMKPCEFKLIQKYRVEREFVGESRGFRTFLVTALGTDEKRILKKVVLKNWENGLAAIYEYLNIMHDANHPQVIPVIEWFRTETEVQIIHTISPGQPILKYFSTRDAITDKDVALIAQQLVSIIKFVHGKRICLRDLSPHNLFYDGEHLYVTNLLDARYKQPRPFSEPVGLPYLMSPEMAMGKYGRSHDIWQAGGILHLLVTGSPVVENGNYSEVAARLNDKDYDIDKFKAMKIDPEIKDMVIRMLDPSKPTRITTTEILRLPLFAKRQSAVKGVFARPSKLTNRLREFAFKDNFREAIHHFLVRHSATVKEKAQALQEFRKMDLNGDGLLSHDEIKSALAEVLGKSLDRSEVESKCGEIFEKLRTRADKGIDYNTFLDFWIDQETFYSEDRLAKYFRVLDVNGNGYISEEEFTAALGGLMGPKEIAEHMKGTNKELGMDFKQFVKLIKTLSDKKPDKV